MAEIKYDGSNVLIMCVFGVRRNVHTHYRSRICLQTPTAHIISTFEPLNVISVSTGYHSLMMDRV